MTTLRWAARLWMRGPGRPRGMAVLVVVGSMAVALLALAPALENAVTASVLDKGALTQIDVAAPVGNADVKPLTQPGLEEMAAIPGVKDVQPEYAAGLYTSPHASGLPGLLFTAHSWRSALNVPIVAGTTRGGLLPGEVILPERVDGVDLRPFLGKKVALAYTKRVGPDSGVSDDVQLRVVALVSSDWQYDGRDAAYADNDTVAAWAAAREGIARSVFLRTHSASRAIVVVQPDADVRAVTARLQKDGYDAVPLADRLRQLPTLVQAFSLLAWIFAIVAAVLFVLVSQSASRQAGVTRLRELALMRTLGISLRELRAQLVCESSLTGVVVGTLSAVLGLGAAALLAPAVGELFGERVQMNAVVTSAQALLFALLVPVLSAGLGSLAGSRRALAEDPYVVASRIG